MDKIREKVVIYDNSSIVMKILDNRHKFESENSIINENCKFGDCYIVMYSITNKNTFEYVKNKIIPNIVSNVKNINFGLYYKPIILCGNKIDVPYHRREVTRLEGTQYINYIKNLYNFDGISFYEISAVDSININEIFMECLRLLRKINYWNNNINTFDNNNESLSLLSHSWNYPSNTLTTNNNNNNNNNNYNYNINIYNNFNSYNNTLNVLLLDNNNNIRRNNNNNINNSFKLEWEGFVKIFISCCLFITGIGIISLMDIVTLIFIFTPHFNDDITECQQSLDNYNGIHRHGMNTLFDNNIVWFFGIGSIINLSLIFFGILCKTICDIDRLQSIPACFISVILLIWSIFGFILYNDNILSDQCKYNKIGKLLLSWCILHTILSFFGCCNMFLLCFIHLIELICH